MWPCAQEPRLRRDQVFETLTEIFGYRVECERYDDRGAEESCDRSWLADLLLAGRQQRTGCAARVPAVREAIVKRLNELSAIGVVSSAACGGDLLALEAASSARIPTRIVLPFAADKFRKTSVIDRPDPAYWGPALRSADCSCPVTGRRAHRTHGARGVCLGKPRYFARSTILGRKLAAERPAAPAGSAGMERNSA